MSDVRDTGRRPMSVWDLHRLLEPVHAYRKPQVKNAKLRPHYLPMLAFIYRNRYVVAQQIQRRFKDVLKSDRTTRRHLTELESLGLIETVPTRGLSPLWPKTYSITASGARRLRRALEKKGKSRHLIQIKRTRREGFSHDHILHELWTTEFLLMLYEASQRENSIEILKTERRSIKSNAGFTIGNNSGGRSWIEPDAMFLLRMPNGGMICCFLEIDAGTMPVAALARKFSRYESWFASPTGREFLIGLYGEHGARKPRSSYRLLFISTPNHRVSPEGRMQAVWSALANCPQTTRRTWIWNNCDGENEADLASVEWTLNIEKRRCLFHH